MNGTIDALYRFPVKGLSGEALDSVALEPGAGFPHDREWGFLRPDSTFDPEHPEPLEKTRFYMLARDAALARLHTRYDPDSETLTIESGGESASYGLADAHDAGRAEAAIAAALRLPEGTRPRLVRGRGHRFTDVSVVSATFMNAVSLINLASVRDLAAKTGTTLDPLRFRGNIVFDGWPAWSELDAEGSMIEAGDVRLKVLLRTRRCAATTVNPQTAERDVFVPRLLTENFGHGDMGIYAEVLTPGLLKPGDTVRLSA